MGNILEQLPGQLDLKFMLGDDFSISLSFEDFDISTCQFSAELMIGASNIHLQVIPDNIAQKVIVTFPKSQITTAGSYIWRFNVIQNNIARKFITGQVVVK